MLKEPNRADFPAQDLYLDYLSKHLNRQHIAVLFKLIMYRKDPAKRGSDVSFLLVELLELGVSPNAVDGSGYTPMVYAVAYGDDTAAQFLISHGADVNLRSGKEGITPLMGAVLKNQFMMARFLLLNGARKDIKDNKGRTAFDIAKQLDGLIWKMMGADLKPN